MNCILWERCLRHHSSQLRRCFSNCILCSAICKINEFENVWVGFMGFSYQRFLYFFFKAEVDTTMFPWPSCVCKALANAFGRVIVVDADYVIYLGRAFELVDLSFCIRSDSTSRRSRRHSNTVSFKVDASLSWTSWRGSMSRKHLYLLSSEIRWRNDFKSVVFSWEWAAIAIYIKNKLKWQALHVSCQSMWKSLFPDPL